jgi:hypothetical protein
MPHVGGSVLVDFLGSTIAGTVTHVASDGRAVEVETDDGATMTFALNRATAIFTANGTQTGARLRFAPRGTLPSD